MEQTNIKSIKEFLLYKKIIAWTENTITLDDGTIVSIEETEQDCCASAFGTFSKVKLDAAITNVKLVEKESWEDGDTYGCRVKIIVLHNQNLVCEVNADADAGNGGYYYSIASFVVKVPAMKEKVIIHCVGSDD